MTLQELIDQLKEVDREYDGDGEMSHKHADRLLLLYINSDEVTKLHGSLAPWYA